MVAARYSCTSELVIYFFFILLKGGGEDSVGVMAIVIIAGVPDAI